MYEHQQRNKKELFYELEAKKQMERKHVFIINILQLMRSKLNKFKTKLNKSTTLYNKKILQNINYLFTIIGNKCDITEKAFL